jgi:hypothetical protein
MRTAILLLISLTLALCALGTAVAQDADDARRELPTPPDYQLPRVDTPDLIVVAADEERRKELSMKGYWAVSEIGRALWSAADGYTIYVTAGTYRENVVLFNFLDLQIIGEEGALVIADNDEDVVYIQECEDIRIHNIDMVHEVGESPCLHNCVVVWDSSDVLIEYCDLSGCGYIGVEVLGNGMPENIRVEHCAIHDCEVAYYDVNGGGALRPINNVIWDCKEKEW